MDELTITLAIRGPLARTDLPGLTRRVCRTLECSAARIVLCDVRGVAADAVAVDALARLQLAAQRRAAQVRLLGASEQLRRLIEFMGLDDVVVEVG